MLLLHWMVSPILEIGGACGVLLDWSPLLSFLPHSVRHSIQMVEQGGVAGFEMHVCIISNLTALCSVACVKQTSVLCCWRVRLNFFGTFKLFCLLLICQGHQGSGGGPLSGS